MKPLLKALASLNVSWRDIVVILMQAVILPMSLLLILLEGLQRAAAGMLVSIRPAMTFQQPGCAQTDFANCVAVTGVIESLVGIAFGAMADRTDLVKVLFMLILLRMFGFVVFAYTEDYWPNDEYFKAAMLVKGIINQSVTIKVVALFIAILLASGGGDTVCG